MRYYAYGGRDARGQQYLVMGPWTHATAPGTDAGELSYPANAAFDVLSAMEQWLGFCLDEQPQEIAGWSPVRIYLMGAVGEAGAPGNRWLGLGDWPPPSTAPAAAPPEGCHRRFSIWSQGGNPRWRPTGRSGPKTGSRHH